MLEEVQSAVEKAVRERGMNEACASQITGTFAQQLMAYTYLVR